MKILMLKCLYWALYLGLSFTAGWFASGVVDNFLSKKTSFSQSEGISLKRPVITIVLKGTNAGKLNLPKDLVIKYCPSYTTRYDNNVCYKINPDYTWDLFSREIFYRNFDARNFSREIECNFSQEIFFSKEV